ncbi:MAG: sodium:solute symporter family transporter [Lacipirellulaceae bacterium]
MAPLPLATAALAPVDIAILAAYLIGTVVWGSWPRKSAATDEGYLLGGRDLAWPVLLMSIVATETSTVTFLSLPGQSYAAGGSCFFLQLTLGYVIGRLAVVALLLPEFFRGSYFTAYEVLQARFGSGTRGAASVLFLVCRTLADGLRLYLTALALQQALGLNLPACILVMTIATAIYSTLGGVSSVVWNDCVQLGVYLVGALAALWLLLDAIPGGLGEVLRFGAETGRLRVLDFDPRLTGPGITFWSGLVGGAFLSVASHGVDHLMVQRYLCARSQRSAALALGLSGPFVAVQFALFLLIGAALARFYATGEFSYTIDKPDQAFSAYLAHEVPVGVSGLLFAAILAAAMSTLSSSLNASAGVLVKDIAEPLGLVAPGNRSLRWAKVATVAFSVLQAAVALYAHATGLASSVIDMVLAIAGFTTGILVGLFALGVLRERCSQAAAYAALATGFAVCVVVIGWPSLTGESGLSWPWNALVASTSTFAAGWAVDRLVPAHPASPS